MSESAWLRLASKVTRSADEADALLGEHRQITVCYPGTQGALYATCSCGWAAPNFGRRGSANRTAFEAVTADWAQHAVRPTKT